MSTTEQVIVQLVVSIATVIGSGVVSAIVTFRLNKQREERNLQRQKLEQLLLATSGYVIDLVKHFMIYERCAEGAYDFDAANDFVIKEGANENRPLETAEMLVAIYFPRLQANLDEILRCRDLASAAISEFKEGYKSGIPTSVRVASGLRGINGLLCDAEDTFKKAVHEIARSLDK